MTRTRYRKGALLGLLAAGLVLGLAYASTRDEQPSRAGAPPTAAAPATPAPAAAPPGGEDAGTVDLARQEADAFAQKVMEALRIAGVRDALNYDPERFLIWTPSADGGQGLTLFLTNVYDDYRAAPPGQRTRVLERIISVHQAPPSAPEAYAQARPALLPVIRPRSYFEMLQVRGTADSPSAAWRPLGEVLAVSLVQDLPDSMRYIHPGDLERWGVSFDEAYAHALANLRARSREPLVSIGPGVCAAAWGDSYSPSRLLLDEVVKRCLVRGEPVVLAPGRDLLLITGAQDEQGLRQVAELAAEALEAPRPMDGRALRRTASGWVPFLPARASASWPALHRLALRSEVRDYADQTEQLNALHLEKGVELFAASLLVAEDEDGRIRTHTLWVNGIQTLLPRADSIIFMEEERGPEAPPVAVVPWEQVVRDVGHLLVREEGLYPERYRLKGFPTPKHFERWKAERTAREVP
ncbi:hypothetical protein [Archangium lansingense]|uniref:DUF1444 family protein n=1 Tax=Archangium lansingense TaxID=2995310 RepID=A0ABT4ANP3_9BACT|nr:hypothetical protein [Archangium lansinium]MCY1082789.1 hypothetical protein [Archangium lansinium]